MGDGWRAGCTSRDTHPMIPRSVGMSARNVLCGRVVDKMVESAIVSPIFKAFIVNNRSPCTF